MASPVSWADVSVGDELPSLSAPLTRTSLVMYAGASGDFNPIHWNETFAKAVGLPDVIAHGMLTMAVAARVVTDWAGDPAALREYGVRFSRPVVVPNDWTGATVLLTARIAEKLDGDRVAVDVVARCGDADVLTNARAVVQLAP